MAGNYPDAPSWRMAIDRDGTQAFKTSSTGVVTAMASTALVSLNDEANAPLVELAGTNQSGAVTFIFPELRDIDGYYVNLAALGQGVTLSDLVLEVSADTTNGQDGTWQGITTQLVQGVDVVPSYRTVRSSTQLAKRAIRIRKTNNTGSAVNLQAFHVYGEPAPGENPNRLALWHPTLDERVAPAYFDWGNVPRASSGDRQFRVKNLSPDATANDVRVAMEALTDGSPSVPGQHSLSFGGGSFLAQVLVGDLAPGAISGLVTLRRITPTNAQLGVWAMRVFAEADTWS